MRIKYFPKDPEFFSEIQTTIDNFNIVQKVFPSVLQSFDNRYVNNLKSYTDGSRTNLNIYDLVFDRCYGSQTLANSRDYLIKNATIRVVEVDFLFETFFSFELFRDDYADFWQNDINITAIKPYFASTSRMYDMGFHTFNSLVTSFFANIVNVLDTNQIMIEMKDNKMILAFGLDEISKSNFTIALENFIDALYQFMKLNDGRQNFILPDPVKGNVVEFNILEEYAKLDKKNSGTKKKFMFQKLWWN